MTIIKMKKIQSILIFTIAFILFENGNMLRANATEPFAEGLFFRSSYPFGDDLSSANYYSEFPLNEQSFGDYQFDDISNYDPLLRAGGNMGGENSQKVDEDPAPVGSGIAILQVFVLLYCLWKFRLRKVWSYK